MASEELPRVLEVSRFAMARQIEIQALCSAIQGPTNRHAFGAEALPRQLRRRATSHNPYKHKKRPNKKLGPYSEARDAQAPQNKEGRLQASRPTNRAMRRRPALLQQACESSCSQDVLRCTHPLTLTPRKLETHTWHAKRMNMFTRWGHMLPEGLVGKGLGSRAFLHALKSGFVLHDSSYSCPIELKGSKQVLQHLLEQVSDLDDITAPHDSLWSDGSEHSFMLFHLGCKPQRPIGPFTLQTLAISQNKSASPSTEQQQHAAVGCGKTLVGCGRTPNPSENQQPDVAQLGPEQLSPNKEEFQARLSGEHPNPDREAKSGHANPSKGQEEVGGSAAADTLIVLVWVHPAAAREAWDTLKDLAQDLGICFTSRVPHLRRLELRGPASDEALLSVLSTVNAASRHESVTGNADADVSRAVGNDADRILKHLKNTGGTAGQVLPEGFAMGFRAADPRLTPTLVRGPPKHPLLASDLRHNAVSALYPVQPCPSLLQPAGQLWHSQQQLQQQQNPSEQTLPALPIPQQHVSPLRETLPQHSAPQPSEDIPEADYSAVLPPLPESRVSMLRQQARLHSLHLSKDAEEEEEQTAPDQNKSVDDEEEEGQDNVQMPAELRGQHSGVCPIVLVRKGSCRKRPQPCGWSLILPAHWVIPFWQALVYRGAKVAGQREWGWACQQLGIPRFPRDCPDCQAAVELTQLLSAEHVRSRHLLPPIPKGSFVIARQRLEATQQKKPKGKRRRFQQASWGLLGQALNADSMMASQRDSAEQQQPVADSALPSGPPQGSGDEPGAKRGDAAISNMETSVGQGGDASGDAGSERGVQCHGLLPAGWWVAHSQASMQRALNAHDSSAVHPDAGTAAATAPVTSHTPQRDAAPPQCVALGRSHQELLPTALDKCLVPVRVQMLGKGNAHAAAAILAHNTAPPQHESPTSPPHDSFQVGGQQARSLRSKSRLCSRPEHKLEPQSQSAELLQHSQHQHAGASQLVEGLSATVIPKGASSQVSQQSKHQAGLSGHDHLGLQQRAVQDDFVGVKRVKVDESAPSGALLDTDKQMLAMECDNGDDNVHPSEQPQMRQSAGNSANVDDSDLEKGHEEEDTEDSFLDGQLRPSVIGFVTSDAPRGLSGEAGARALCSVPALRQLYHEQVEGQVLRSSRHGIVVQIKNVGSSQCWKAALHWTDSVPWHRILLPVKPNVERAVYKRC